MITGPQQVLTNILNEYGMKMERKTPTDEQEGNRIELKLGACCFLNTYSISNGKITSRPRAHMSMRSINGPSLPGL